MAKQSTPPVAKTIKLFIGGKFPRTESGRTFPVPFHKSHKSKGVYAHVCLGSKKDIRAAVEAAKAALPSWSSRTAFNRSQILYRMAEMCEGKRAELSSILMDTLGYPKTKAEKAVDDAVSAFVYYAGFADKYTQVLASVNSVNGPYHNFTSAQGVGVVGLIGDSRFDLGELISQISSVLCSGNSLVVVLEKAASPLLSALAEVFATSDLPGGVVNLVSGDVNELWSVLSGHMEVDSISYQGRDAKILTEIQTLATKNMKRVVKRGAKANSLENLTQFLEFKTVWHPIGV